jgi:hypothetical protein
MRNLKIRIGKKIFVIQHPAKIPRNYACIAPILRAGCIRIPKWCRAPNVRTIP